MTLGSRFLTVSLWKSEIPADWELRDWFVRMSSIHVGLWFLKQSGFFMSDFKL